MPGGLSARCVAARRAHVARPRPRPTRSGKLLRHRQAGDAAAGVDARAGSMLAGAFASALAFGFVFASGAFAQAQAHARDGEREHGPHCVFEKATCVNPSAFSPYVM